MSNIDSQIIALHKQIAALEEQKRIMAEKKSETFPLKTLEMIVNEYEHMVPGKINDRWEQERWRESRKKLRFLTPILDALKDIQERLDILEEK